MLTVVSLLRAILFFAITIGAFYFSSTTMCVLLSIVVLTLLVFRDLWRSPPTTELAEDYACDLERNGWLRHARR